MKATRSWWNSADNGGGVAHPEHLFRPFQAGAEATGLGLYLSRAFMRSFGGELRYLPIPDGACFVVSLTPASYLDRISHEPQFAYLWSTTIACSEKA